MDNITNRVLIAFLVVGLLGPLNSAMAVLSFELVSAGTGPSGYSRSYDIMATTDGVLGAIEMIVNTAQTGSIYQNASSPAAPDDAFDADIFDTYVTFNSAIGENPAQTTIFGPAVDLVPGSSLAWTTQNLNLAWVPAQGQQFSNNTFQVGRITLSDTAHASYQITGYDGLGVQGELLEGIISAPPPTFSMVPFAGPGAPLGYTAYDFFGDINTNIGALELVLDTDTAGDIYQNSAVPDDAAEDFDTYVTIGLDNVGTTGENPAQTQIFGAAVDIVPFSSMAWTDQNLNVAWIPSAGFNTGPGLFHLGRVTLKDTATGSWTLKGWQGGSDDPVTVTNTIPSAILGDVNGDGWVGGVDLTRIIANWGLTGMTRSGGDLSGDGLVSGLDYTEVVSNWATGTPIPPPQPVPEPATLGLLGLLGLGALLRPRKRYSTSMSLPRKTSGKKRLKRIIPLLLVVVLLVCGSVALADVDDLTLGHQTLLDIGLQIAPWTDVGNADDYPYPGDFTGPVKTTTFNLARWNESNFTTIGFADRAHYADLTNYPGYAPAPTGLPMDNSMPWTRMLGFIPGITTHLEPWELDFLPSLTSLVIGDEQDLTVQLNLDTIENIVNYIHTYYPGVIAHTAQAGTQVVNMGTGAIQPSMIAMMAQTKQDMVFVNQYPYVDPATYSLTNGPSWQYTVFERVRELGLAGNDGTGDNPVPTGLYTQAFADYAPGGVNPTWYRPPSESEIRHQHFTAWAYGFKAANPYCYDNIKDNLSLDGVMFEHDGTEPPYPYTGQDSDPPTPTFYHFAEVTRQSLNLSPALTKLISTDTGVRMVMGEHDDGGTVPNPLPTANTAWSPGDDPYITAITATNLGTKNNGLRGDVIVGYLKPLDASFVDPGYEDDDYFMIVNGLNDFDGSSAQTQQNVRIDFDFGSDNIDSLIRLSRDTGEIERVDLISDGGSAYHLDLVLDGGTGDLFKFNNGGRFVGGLALPMTLEMVEVTDPGAPVGHTSYDLRASTMINLGVMELIVEADSAGDIYQNTDTLYLQDEEFDTYVDMPVTFSLVGSAGDIDPFASQTWTDQDLNIAWAPAGGETTGAGDFQIARITLKNSASGSLTLMGWDTAFPDDAIILSVDFGLLPGDVDGNGYVSGLDLTTIITNWGLTGATREQGDLNGDGTVAGADYTEVITYWGTGTPPPEPGSIPEPAALALMLAGCLLALRRRN